MSTGPSSDSAEPPPEPGPPFTSSGRFSWLTSRGRHPLTWGLAGLVLVASIGFALLQQQPGARAGAQSVPCGLVTCAVLRSVADSSTVTAGPTSPSAALPSPSRTPAPTLMPTPAPARAATAGPDPAASPTPAPAPTPEPMRTWAPGPAHWPWPPRWPPRWPPAWPRHGGGGWYFPPGHSGWHRPRF